MNIRAFLQQAAGGSGGRKAIPVLSFPAVQKLNISVKELLLSPELQAEAMACIACETDSAAAVSLMDLSVEAEALGAEVRYFEDEVPTVTGQSITTAREAEALQLPPVAQCRTALCAEAISLAKEKITDKPVFAGMTGPFSLAGRLMGVTEILYVCFDEPETVHTVLRKATDFLLAYGRALKAAGADGILLAEPLAGILSPAMAAEFSVPYVKTLVEALQEESFALIYHNCGNSACDMLPEIFSQGAMAYHFGNSADMAAVMAFAPADTVCMGNIDPAAHFTTGTAQSMEQAVKELLDRCGGYRNFLLSSGCDIPPHARWENIEAFFAALKAYEN